MKTIKLLLLSLVLGGCTATEETPDCKCGVISGVTETFSPQRGIYYKIYIKTDCGTIVRDSDSKSELGSQYCEN